MTSTTSSRRLLRTPAATAAAVAGLVLLLGACASGSDGDSAGGDSGVAQSVEEVTGEAPVPASDGGGGVDSYEGNADGVAAETPDEAQNTQVAQRAVISTATVSLRSDDVAAAMFDVQKIVDEYSGEIADEKTDGDEETRRSRLVIRVPSAEFDEAIADLKQVGEVVSSTRRSEDVTTTVIDNAARIRAQEESLERVEVLLARAASIRDIVAIEAQLTRRQADLDSLKSQQAFLADQTSLSTITVHIEPTPKNEPKPDSDETGFLAGLDAGWDALTKVGSGLATAVGAVLPFAIVFGVLGVPAWLVGRRLIRHRPASPAAPAAP